MTAASRAAHGAAHVFRGIAFSVTGVTILAVSDILVKFLGGRYPVLQFVFVRSLVAVPVITLLALQAGGVAMLKTRRPLGNLVRGGLMVTSYSLFCLAVVRMPLAETIAFTFTSPLLITALAVPMLREHVGIHRSSAVLVGFVGVVVMLQPGEKAIQPAALIAIASAFAYALSTMITRRLGPTEPAYRIAFYTMLMFLLAGAPLMPWLWAPVSLIDFAMMGGSGLCAAFGHFCIVQSYRLAPASTIAPFEYVGIVWAVVFGWLIWSEFPGPHILVGILLVVASGLYVLYRERRLGRSAVSAPAPEPRTRPT
ncbi:MAG: DMT family transporter [Alphaproteobacteria bacterium]